MKEEIGRWIEQAKHDLHAASNSLSAGDFDWAIFQAQQAAEKALKVLYIKNYKELRKVHDLNFLAKKLMLPGELTTICAQLTQTYVETRYPNASGVIPAKKFTKKDTEFFISIATKVMVWVEKRL